jgi:DNA polymerase IV
MNACVENVAPTMSNPAFIAQDESANAVAFPKIEERGEGRVTSDELSREDEGGVQPPLREADDELMVTAEKRSWFLTRWLGRTMTRRAEKLPHIVHVHLDAFFASVEQVLNPRLAGKPVLVGRGVVAAASYEAKFHGVKTAMSIRDALRSCPKAIVVAGQYERYAEFAERVRHILETYTPTVESGALNDFYLDFAGSRHLDSSYEAALRRLQAEILARTGLSVSIGAGRSKVVAAMASRLGRPRGFRIVAPGMEQAFLAPMLTEKLPGIARTDAVALTGRGIATIGQLRMVPKPVLVAAFGDVIGRQIWERARGLDGRKLMLPSMAKSVSRETTFEDGTIDKELLAGLLEYLSERVGSTLREYCRQANTVALRLRYVDDFCARETVRLIHHTNDERELLGTAKELFAKLFTRRGVAIRDVGVSASGLDISAAQRASEPRPKDGKFSMPLGLVGATF